MTRRGATLFCGLLAGLAAGCGTATPDGAPDSGTPDAGPVSSDVCTQPTEVACADAIIQSLDLQKPVSPGLVTNTVDGYGWISKIDATAGGFNADPPQSYVYAKFTQDGLEKVALGDEAALESMDWDIAFKRYVIRINSADSGPSCVAAARMPGSPAYDDVTGAPDDLVYRPDDHFSDACTLIDDGSGLPSSPGTSLASYYRYDNCVKMAGHVYIVRLRGGELLKLTVTGYYASGQAACDASGTRGTGSGNITLRWAWL